MDTLNLQNDPYLKFAEEERRQGKRLFSPWTTSDPELLNLAKEYFPEISITPSQLLEKPDLSPVEILALKDNLKLINISEENAVFIAVGGPPAAAVALQKSINGDPVLYVSDIDRDYAGKKVRPIWAGAGNHGEPDALTEAPAYIAGYLPFRFILREVLQFVLQKKYNKSIISPDYPWLNLNLIEWLKNPRQWLSGFRVAFGNHLLSKRYTKSIKNGKTPDLLIELRNRTHASGDYLEALNKSLGGILRKPRGSLIVASSQKQLKSLLRDREALIEEGRELRLLQAEEAQEKYGLTPRNAIALMEKTHDFIFEPDFLTKLLEEIKIRGGEIKTNWRLSRVYIDTDKKIGGVLEFEEIKSNERKQYFRKFSSAHLSLGATPFNPNVYDLISVTGVSMNVLIIGANFNGGPIVCGGTNHLVPLVQPKFVKIKKQETGEAQLMPITIARLSAAGSVGPHDRGKDWYTYDGYQALHLLHRVRETLPQEMILRVLSVTGCNRVIGKDGRQVELHPKLIVANKSISCEQVTIQIGAGGGGLTQMGAIPKIMSSEPP